MVTAVPTHKQVRLGLNQADQTRDSLGKAASARCRRHTYVFLGLCSLGPDRTGWKQLK